MFKQGYPKLPSSLRYLTSGLKALYLPEVQNLDLSFAQYGFKSLTNLDLSHFDRNMVDLNIWWLRPDYFPVLETLGLSYLTSGPNTLHLPEVQNLDLSFAQCGFKSLTNLDLSHFDRNMVDLNIWLKPDHFPVLKTLELSNSNIVTIPESITKFTRLQFLDLYNCKQLQEIPRLPQSIVKLNAQRCRSLDLQSSRRLLDQCGEFLGILPGSNPYRDVMCHVKVLINGEEEDESNLDDESNLYVLMEKKRISLKTLPPFSTKLPGLAAVEAIGGPKIAFHLLNTSVVDRATLRVGIIKWYIACIKWLCMKGKKILQVICKLAWSIVVSYVWLQRNAPVFNGNVKSKIPCFSDVLVNI
nr:hypothetical protein CFP56_49682 [Quercus suber]